MKYDIFGRESKHTTWSIIYCNFDGKETFEDIVKAISTEQYVGKFNRGEHMNAAFYNDAFLKINNNNDLFILRDSYGFNNIWQVGGEVSDITGFIVPHLYKVRKIGFLIG